MRKILYIFIVIFVIKAGFHDSASAYNVPQDNSKAQYFYVFGPEGRSNEGADRLDNEQIIFFDVPQSENEKVTIDIFDPDTGGKLDQKDSLDKTWDTIVGFMVYGKGGALLNKKNFSESAEYDMNYYRFGPYKKEMGERIGEFYRFKLVASPLKTLILRGKELNLFMVRVLPESVETFSNKIFLRLLPNIGDEMYFYPEIPASVSKISVQNYDVDPDGGFSLLYDPLARKSYNIKDSASGAWAETKVDIQAFDAARRLKYVITTKTQQHGNAAIRVRDNKGNLLPVYFSEAVREKEIVSEAVTAIVSACQSKISARRCNEFTFDGTSSYDSDNEKLSFLWDFGDKTQSTESVVTHVFEKGGKYEVTLTVKDSSGLECDTASITQIVKVNNPPVAIAGPNFACCINTKSVFNGSSSFDADGDSLSYFWDFGDGATGSGIKATHTYNKAGTYSVVLKVDDNSQTACSSSETLFQVRVKEQPVPIIKIKD